jgi:hypothetical protein
MGQMLVTVRVHAHQGSIAEQAGCVVSRMQTGRRSRSFFIMQQGCNLNVVWHGAYLYRDGRVMCDATRSLQASCRGRQLLSPIKFASELRISNVSIQFVDDWV